jgi:CubicO group peptidase (beta-lactamase class C family)
LYEQGKFQLTDPVSKFIPELKDLKVMKNGKVVPAQKQMTMQQLLKCEISSSRASLAARNAR